MKDNFDLKKFLKESKAIENLNPSLKAINEKEDKSLKENSLKSKIREMIIDELSNIADLGTSAVVLNAGTVTTGAFDPIEKYFKMFNGNSGTASPKWTHIDAAWGGPLALSTKYNKVFNGIEHADSFGFSAHKWLYQPKGSAVCLFKNVNT